MSNDVVVVVVVVVVACWGGVEVAKEAGLQPPRWD
jgi:hypothetical protein